MKSVLCIAFWMIVNGTALCQNEDDPIEYPQYKLSFTYGLTAKNPERNNIDEHLEDEHGLLLSNGSFNLKGEATLPMREMLITLTLRPLGDNKLLILRGGLLQTQYSFKYTISETSGNSTATGKFTDVIKEKYSIYPFSVGGGYSTPIPYIQIHAEAIVALGYVTEENVLNTSAGEEKIISRTYHAETIGLRFGVQLNPQLSNLIGLHLEGGYRLLGFSQFFDDVTDESIPLDFSMTGWFFNGGITVAL